MKLLGCPFCGDTPYFTSLKWDDNNYYAGVNLECCITMDERVGWKTTRGMTDSEIAEMLKEKLTKRWNERDDNGTE